MKEKKRNTVLLTIIGIATLLVAVVGATFAFFSAQQLGNETATNVSITSSNGGTSGFTGGEAITLDAIYPRDAAWVNKKITVTYNNGTTTAGTYKYHFIIHYTNLFTAGQLTYTFIGGYCGSTTDDLVYDTQSACTGAGKSWNANNITVGTPVTDVATQTAIGNGSADITSLSDGTFNIPTSGEVSHTYVLRIYFPNLAEVSQNDEQGKTFTAYVTYEQVQ